MHNPEKGTLVPESRTLEPAAFSSLCSLNPAFPLPGPRNPKNALAPKV